MYEASLSFANLEFFVLVVQKRSFINVGTYGASFSRKNLKNLFLSIEKITE